MESTGVEMAAVASLRSHRGRHGGDGILMGCDISVTVRFALLTSSVRDVCVRTYGHQCEGVRAALDVNGPWAWAVRTCRTGRMGAAWAAAWPAGFAYHGSYRRRESLIIPIVLMCGLACSLIVGRLSRTLPIQLLENNY